MTNNPAIASALEMIGEGFMQLAFALRAEPTEEKPTARKRVPKETKAEEPEVESPTGHEDEEALDQSDAQDDVPLKPAKVKLSDLQEIAAGLLKGGKRSKFLKVLTKHGLKNLSSAPEVSYDDLWTELTEAAAGE